MPAIKKRRQSDAISQPATKVIDYVGIIAVLTLLLSGILYALGRDGSAALSLVNICVTGMLALLAKTTPQTPEPQEVVGPNGGALPVTETGKSESDGETG